MINSKEGADLQQRDLPVVDRSNEEWLAKLSGTDREPALTELRSILLAGLHAALRPGPGRLDSADIEDFVQDALIRIVTHLGTFRGDSQFTTWANRIAVRVAFSQMRRKRWREISLDAIRENDTLVIPEPVADDMASQPEQLVSERMFARLLARIIETDLTQRQRTALTAVIVHGVPIEELALKMETNRNALYKLLHDARRRLKTSLEREGVDLEHMYCNGFAG